MINFVIILECFGLSLTAIALFLLLNGDGAREQKLLIMILCGSFVQNVGYLLELIAPTVEAAMIAVTVTNPIINSDGDDSTQNIFKNSWCS